MAGKPVENPVVTARLSESYVTLGHPISLPVRRGLRQPRSPNRPLLRQSGQGDELLPGDIALESATAIEERGSVEGHAVRAPEVSRSRRKPRSGSLPPETWKSRVKSARLRGPARTTHDARHAFARERA